MEARKKMIFSCKIYFFADYHYVMHLKNILTALAISCLALSCAKDAMYPQFDADNPSYGWVTAIVSIKQSPDDTVFFQLSDNERLFPENWQDRFEKVCRLYCRLYIFPQTVGSYGKKTRVEWAEALEEGRYTTDSDVSGSDGLDILDDWMTGVEDGFLTLHYSTWWGNGTVQHKLAVVAGTNAEDPYELQLRHDACGDARKEQTDALIYFDINDLPSTGGEYKTLTLKWTNCAGKLSERKYSFKSRE